MPREDRSAVGVIPCTTIERTLVDIGAVVPPRRLEALVVEACRGPTTIALLRERLTRPAGRSGAARLRKLLDDWGDLSPPESVLESSLRRLMRRHRLPLGHPQWPVVHRGRIVARVDVAYPDRRIAIEADGYRWHGNAARWRDDLARRNALAQLGWRVLHFTWTDVHRHPERVATEIRGALSRREDVEISR
jgi:very-short-patch-repair endonuclease